MFKRFDNRTTNVDFMRMAILKADSLLSPDSELMKEVAVKNDFRFNSGPGAEIVDKLIYCSKVAPIYFYKPVNPFTAAMGYSKNGEIFFNTRKFKAFSLADVVGLLLHEYSHVAGFGHAGNFKTEEKINYSVPYFLSENAARFL